MKLIIYPREEGRKLLYQKIPCNFFTRRSVGYFIKDGVVIFIWENSDIHIPTDNSGMVTYTLDFFDKKDLKNLIKSVPSWAKNLTELQDEAEQILLSLTKIYKL